MVQNGVWSSSTSFKSIHHFPPKLLLLHIPQTIYDVILYYKKDKLWHSLQGISQIYLHLVQLQSSTSELLSLLIKGMAAKLILLFSCILLQLTALTLSDPVRHTKLIRARREVALPGLYFVSTMDDVDSKQFSSKLQTMQKNGSFPPGFQMELHGFASLVAHGFFARLSSIAVTEVSYYLLHNQTL